MSNSHIVLGTEEAVLNRVLDNQDGGIKIVRIYGSKEPITLSSYIEEADRPDSWICTGIDHQETPVIIGILNLKEDVHPFKGGSPDVGKLPVEVIKDVSVHLEPNRNHKVIRVSRVNEVRILASSVLGEIKKMIYLAVRTYLDPKAIFVLVRGRKTIRDGAAKGMKRTV